MSPYGDQKADQVNFIKFSPLIKYPQPFFHYSAEPKITDLVTDESEKLMGRMGDPD